MADNKPVNIPAGRCAFCRRKWSVHETYKLRDYENYRCGNPPCIRCGRSMRIAESGEMSPNRWIFVCFACGTTKKLTDKQKQEDRQ